MMLTGSPGWRVRWGVGVRADLVDSLLIVFGVAMVVAHRRYARALEAGGKRSPFRRRGRSPRLTRLAVIGMGSVFIVGGIYQLTSRHR